MAGEEILLKYFPDLSERQIELFSRFEELFREWNEKINMVSRKDVDNLFERHILHSLGIAKIIRFTPGTSILDVGTGGGFPGLPLAIYFSDTEFLLVDSIGKKIKVVDEIARILGLENVRSKHARVEELKEKFDFVTGRAVTDLASFFSWVKNKISSRQINSLPNGILYLKGGDVQEELKQFKDRGQYFPLSDYFDEEFFETKGVVYIEAAG